MVIGLANNTRSKTTFTTKMNDTKIQDIPKKYEVIQQKSAEIGFSMPSDLHVGTLLKTLVSSKPNGAFLELGTGIGLSLSWMVDGLDVNSELTTIDNDAQLSNIAKEYFGNDDRVHVLCTDAAQWIDKSTNEKFDLIFADAWPGKYSHLDKTLNLVKNGGLYVIDDMSEQPNWPDGHDKKAADLITYLESREDFCLTKMNWSTGIVIAVKKL